MSEGKKEILLGDCLELIEKYIFINGNSFFAKDCVIVAVDEIIKELTDLWKILDKQCVFGASNPTTIRIKYYESVKLELEKL